ncbi:hypothetical protein H0E86_14300 [Streptomyces sp. SCSIO-PteL053]|nr:hypothetical protein H0E86_14300 [Streptomyces sp. SCSIO-PteL053]
MAGKTNSTTRFAALLAPNDLTGVTVTADAQHCHRQARLLTEVRNVLRLQSLTPSVRARG